MTILVLHGPEPADPDPDGVVVSALGERAKVAGLALRHERCTNETQLLDRLARIDRGQTDIILFEPGRAAASVPVREALDTLRVPYIEVHGNDSAASVDAGDGCARLALISGFQAQGLALALELALERLGCDTPESEVHVGT